MELGNLLRITFLNNKFSTGLHLILFFSFFAYDYPKGLYTWLPMATMTIMSLIVYLWFLDPL